MLTPFDDFPVHQTPDPLTTTLGGHPNHYDRFFFNGYARDASLYFGVALGVYPNRQVMDASFSVVRDGVQTSVHASRRAPADRTETVVGPVRVMIEEPMRRLRVVVGPNEADVEADLVFSARTVAVEEPRFTVYDGPTRTWDYTRLTQWGTWSGSVTVEGVAIGVEPAAVLGCRDRSWGVRPVGEGTGGAPRSSFQFFWLWAPLHFEDCCVHFDVNEDGDGRQWHAEGVVVPLLAGPDAAVVDRGGDARAMASVEHSVAWRPGTRRSEGATLTLRPGPGDDAGETIEIDLVPVLDFQMLGIGYVHPEWGHGMWKGEHAVGAEQWRLAELDLLDPRHVHVQQLVTARWGDRTGIGILEQAVFGPHAPSGFRELLDGA